MRRKNLQLQKVQMDDNQMAADATELQRLRYQLHALHQRNLYLKGKVESSLDPLGSYPNGVVIVDDLSI